MKAVAIVAVVHDNGSIECRDVYEQLGGATYMDDADAVSRIISGTLKSNGKFPLRETELPSPIHHIVLDGTCFVNTGESLPPK